VCVCVCLLNVHPCQSMVLLSVPSRATDEVGGRGERSLALSAYTFQQFVFYRRALCVRLESFSTICPFGMIFRFLAAVTCCSLTAATLCAAVSVCSAGISL
jgi:hypothetical protein